MAQPSPQFTELLYRAAASHFGIAVGCTDPAAARKRFYLARAQLADPELADLSFSLNPLMPDRELWLVKRKKEEAKKPPKADAAE